MGYNLDVTVRVILVGKRIRVVKIVTTDILLINNMQNKEKNKIDGRDLTKCSCGFKFSSPGEFRNCDAFITEDGKSGVICPNCGREYIYD